MNGPYYLPGSGPGPIRTALAAVGAALVVVAGFFFGFFVLVTLFGLLLLVAIAVRLRLWWLKRRMEQELRQWSEVCNRPEQGEIIEGEVVRRGRREPPTG